VSLFLKPPVELDPLPPTISFDQADLDGLTLATRLFTEETQDISPEGLEELTGGSPEPIAFSRFERLNVIFTKPEDVAEILIDSSRLFLKGDEERVLAAIVGWGLLAQEGDSHRRMQKALNPGIRGQVLDTYLPKVGRVFAHHVAHVANSPRRLVAFSREVSQAAAEATIFGSDHPEIDPSYHLAVLEINRFAMSGATPGRKSASSDMPGFIKAKITAENHLEQLVSGWKERRATSPTFMDYLAQGTNSYEDSTRRLFDQAGMFMQAATETTASLISWALVHLSGQDKHWERLHEEAMKRPDHPLTHDFVKSLDFHQSVISETLRIAPPVWMIPRVVSQDCKIGHVSLQRGTRVLLSPWVTQRLEQYFPDATSFSPDRWLNSPQPQRGSYFPFGLGGRICIGESYGRMAAVAMLYHLARSGKVATVSGESAMSGTSHLLSSPHRDLYLTISDVG
jgi:cytochrome P450